MRRTTIGVGLCVSAMSVCAGSACSPPPPATAERAVQTAAPTPPVYVSVKGALNRMPSLAVSGRRVVLVWTATANDVMHVYAAASEDSGSRFSSPVQVSDSTSRVSANAEQPPRVTMSGETVTIIWPSRHEGGAAIRMSRSVDGGRSFSDPVPVHASGLTGLRGWQSIAGGRDGAVHAVWLDGRHAEKPAGGHHHHGASGGSAGDPPRAAPRQDVYAAVIAPDGSIAESHVARDVCFCCKTAVGVGASGRVYVAWRHIFPESIRDIAFAISEDAGRTFGPLARVSQDDWKLSGCPDDGPALAVDLRETVHLVWPTLVQGETPRKAIFYSSTADGRTFSARVPLSGEQTEDAGHPQIAADGAGDVAALWDEQAGDRRSIAVRLAKKGSGVFAPVERLTNIDSGFHPVVTGLDRGFVAAWADGSGDRSAIQIRRFGL